MKRILPAVINQLSLLGGSFNTSWVVSGELCSREHVSHDRIRHWQPINSKLHFNFNNRPCPCHRLVESFSCVISSSRLSGLGMQSSVRLKTKTYRNLRLIQTIFRSVLLCHPPFDTYLFILFLQSTSSSIASYLVLPWTIDQ